MDPLSAFGLFGVSGGLVCYALEEKSHWYIFGFAFFCALSAVYGFLQGAWPFGLAEIVWTATVLRRWLKEKDKRA